MRYMVYRFQQIVSSLENKGKIWIISPYGLGDTYIVCSFYNSFCKKNHKNAVIVAKKSHNDVINMFECGKIERLLLTENHMQELVTFYKYNSQDSVVYANALITDEIIHSYHVKGNLSAKINDLSLDKSIVLEVVKHYVLGLDGSAMHQIPNNVNTIEETFYINKYQIIPKKTILICPDANSMQKLPCAFWINIVKTYEYLGYRVLVNSNKKIRWCKEDKIIRFPLRDAIGVVELCGFVIGLRSGFFDIINTANAKFIVMYTPPYDTAIDWSLKSLWSVDEISFFIGSSYFDEEAGMLCNMMGSRRSLLIFMKAWLNFQKARLSIKVFR